jgi:hypothetical protein
MTDAPSNQFVMIGLPATGKTSFLAALWYLVQHAQVERRLELEHFEGDIKYLNQIADLWVTFEVVPRTTTSSERTVSMILRDTTANKVFTLTVPDLSGEAFALQLVARQFTVSYNKFLQASSGAILFISPLNYRKPVRISMAVPLIREMGAAASDGEADDNSSTAWDPAETPTQAQLVELLQFIAERDYFKPPFRLALIISAWDQLKGVNKTPAKWLADELPLVAQFLESNRRLFDYTLYGVSAQGGDYKETDRLTHMAPSERIQIVGAEVKNSHDLTEPLIWLMR